jgi:hypothetical protein
MDEQKTNQNQKQDQNKTQQTPNSEKAPIADKKHKERFYNLKLLAAYFLISSTLSSMVMLIMFLIRAISSPTKAAEQFTEIPTIISIIIAFVVSPILTIVMVNNHEKKKHPQSANNATAPIQAETTVNNATAPIQAETTVRSIVGSLFLNFLFTVLLFILFAGISGIWASSSCKGNDCASGWTFGFFLLPASFIAALAIAPFLTALVKKRRK